jgi:hypothetical protein
MATTKRFTLAATTGTSPVLVIARGSDGFIRDALDGVFRDPAVAAIAYLPLTEDPILTGWFTAAITGEVWPDDIYTILFYASSAMDAATGDYAADPGGAVSLVEYALCTLQQVKSELNIPVGDTGEDDRIARAINDATDRIETDTNRKLKKRAANVTEYSDVAEEDDTGTSVIWPQEYPVESISDVISLSTGTKWDNLTAIDLATVAVDRGRVIVSLETDLNEGTRCNCLVYRPGYTSPPQDIAGVAINVAQRLYWNAKRIQAGDSEETVHGQARRKDPAAYSADDQLVINAYKRLDAGVWKSKTAKYRAWTR